MKTFIKIKYYIMVKTKRLRCSGYGVYPNGILCPGCSDCQQIKGEKKWMQK